MASFDLTANINARLVTSNVRAIADQLRQQLSVTASVNVSLATNTATNVTQLSNRLRNLHRQLALVTQNSGSANTALRQLGQTFQNINGQLAANNRAQQNLNNVATAAHSAGTQMEQFGRQAGLAFRRFAGFRIASGFVTEFLGAVTGSVKEAISFQRQLVRISQVSGQSLSSLSSLTKEIDRLSTSLGTSSTDLINISRILKQAGLSTLETKQSLEALAKSTLAPTFTDIGQTAEGAIAIFKQFGIQANQLEAALGGINAVSGQFAVESDDIIAAVKRAGGVFAALSEGLEQGPIETLNQFVATFTSVRATTREGAETIATGLRTIFTRIQRPTTIAFLQDLGVNLLDLQGKFVGPFEAINRISTALKNLDSRDPQFARLVEELGGFRQVGKVIPLLTEQETRLKALKVAQEGQNSLTKDSETAQQALAVQLVKVREEFNALIREIANSSSFKASVDIILKLASSFIKLADSVKPILPLLTAFVAFKGASLGSQFLRGLSSPGAARFHSGGIVPGGRGIRDDVPATLQQGEFVIRRRAVDKIGRGNLDKLNRQGFDAGGLVNQNTVGAAVLTPFNSTFDKSVTVHKGDKKTQVPNLPNKTQNFNVIGEALNEADSKLVTTKIIAGAVTGIKQGTKALTGISVDDGSAKNIFQTANPAGVLGSIFEGVLLAINSNGLFESSDIKDSNRPFDFVNGFKGPFGKRFKSLTGLSYIDAKFSEQSASVASFRKKITNQLNLELGRPDDNQLSKAEIDKRRRTHKSNIRFEKNKKTGLKFLAPGFGPDHTPFDSGGSVPGAVPAMLTRGEFVFNRGAAQSLGLNNLNRLNNADRFASGGLVGRKHFASGGFVDDDLEDLLRRPANRHQTSLSQIILSRAESNRAQGILSNAESAREQRRDRILRQRAAQTSARNARQAHTARARPSRGLVRSTVNRGRQSFRNLRSSKFGGIANPQLLAGGAFFAGSQIGGTLGAGVTGAASGAALGSGFGPVGAAAGGVIGGIMGAFQAFADSKLDKKTEELTRGIEKSLEGLNKGLENFKAGGDTKLLKDSLGTFGRREQQVRDVNNQRLGSFGDFDPLALAEDIQSQLAPLGEGAQILFDAEINAGKTVEQALSTIGEGGVRALAFANANQKQLRQLGNTENRQFDPFGNRLKVSNKGAANAISEEITRPVLEQREKQIKLENELAAAMQNANVELDNFNKNLELVSTAIIRAGDAGDRFSQQNAAILSGGITSSAQINPFDNPTAFSPAELGAAAANSVKRLGGNDTGFSGDLLKSVVGLRDAQDRLPEIILQAANQAGNASDGPAQANAITEAIQREFGDALPKSVLNSLTSTIKGQTETSRQAISPRQFAQDSAAKLVAAELKGISEPLSNEIKVRNAAILEYEKATGDWINLQKSANDTFDSVVQQTIRNDNQIASLNRDLTPKEQLAGFNAQQNLGALRAGAPDASVRSIVDRLAVLDKSRTDLQGQAALSRQFGTGDAQAISDQQGQVQNQINFAEDVLKQIAFNTNVAAVATQGLERIENAKKTAQQLAEEVLTASPQELRQINRDSRLGQQLQSGAQLTGDRAVQGLRGIKRDSATASGTITDRQIQDKINQVLVGSGRVNQRFSQFGQNARERIIGGGAEERGFRADLINNGATQLQAGGEVARRRQLEVDQFLENQNARFESIKNSLGTILADAADTLSLVPKSIEIGGLVTVDIKLTGQEVLNGLGEGVSKLIDDKIRIALRKNIDPQQQLENQATAVG